jgi:hypothetical protein
MKKTVFGAVLALAAVAASAADLTGFVKYDYDKAESVALSNHLGAVGVKAAYGAAGAVDVAVLGDRSYTPGRQTQAGYEIGYSNGVKLGAVGLNGRVAFAHLIETKTDAFRVAAEGTLPVTQTVTAFAGVEHFREDNTAVANRFTVGADFAVSKAVSIRAGVARTNVTGSSLVGNGLTTAVSYKF